MSTAAKSNVENWTGIDARLLREGYGSGAWHGPDLKAALSDVEPELAYWRPAAGRHNIAEIAMHHAFCVRNVHAQLSGTPAEPFVLDGEDWFDISSSQTLSWADIQATVDALQRRLVTLVEDLESGHTRSPLTEPERHDLVIGITAHAIYHAGQMQLIKRLRA